MTLGEKIKLYRNQLNLSQEELAKQLSVETKAIALWEEDKSTPTAENLLGLKQFFNISLDDLLDKNNVTGLPNETYKFKYTADELNKISNATIKHTYKRSYRMLLILTIVFMIVTVSTILGKTDPEITFFFAGGLLTIAIFIYLFRKATEKNYQMVIPNIIDGDYEFKIYDDYIILQTYRNKDMTKRIKMSFAEIQKVLELDKFFQIQHNNQLYIFKKEAMDNSSKFYAFLNNHPNKKVLNPAKHNKEIKAQAPSPQKTTTQNTSTTAKNSKKPYFYTLLSISGGLLLVSILSLIFVPFFIEYIAINTGTSFSWVFYFFLPLPIALIIIGFFIKPKKPWKLNITLGIIFTLAFALLGTAPLISSSSYSPDTGRVKNIENLTGIDIPNHKQIDTHYSNDYSLLDSKNHSCANSIVHFAQKDVEEFERQLTSDDRWLTSIPDDMMSTLYSNYQHTHFDYSLIYNVDTNEFNTIPTENGTYKFINLFYTPNQNKMVIVEYDLVYVKPE